MNNEIIQALAGLDIPVSFQHYLGTANTYITFFAYDEQDEEFSDDEVESEGYYPQIDVWSKEDYTNLKSQIKSAMKTAGYSFTNGQDLYEEDTGIFHLGLRFFKAKYLI